MDGGDFFAGLSLIVLALFFISLYAIVAFVMFRGREKTVGFRYLFSAAISGILLLFNYGVWPGLVILTKSEITTESMRPWVHMYLDWAWFASCNHYTVVAWSRFVAVTYPSYFRRETKAISYSVCGCCYVAALVLVLCTNFQPWYVTFYYEPSAYGMVAEDFEKYLNEGHSAFFFAYHLIVMSLSIIFYTLAVIFFVRHKQLLESSLHPLGRASNTLSHISSQFNQRNFSIETRLIAPCVLNTALFILGQVLVMMSTSKGKWTSWSVMLLFCANSAVNPILLLAFSKVIRERTFKLLGIARCFRDRSVSTYISAEVSQKKPVRISSCELPEPRLLKADKSTISCSTAIAVEEGRLAEESKPMARQDADP